MTHLHTKFKVSTLTHNEDRGNIKCKNCRFEPPFGNLGVTHRIHLCLDGKRVVDFLLVKIELFSLAITAEALLSEICQNILFLYSLFYIRRFVNGWVTFSTNVM